MKKATKPIHKHTLNLYQGDYEILQQCYPDLGAGRVIRDLVRSYIRKNSLEVAVSPIESNVMPELIPTEA